MIDESTSVSVDKYLCIMIRYYSESKSKISTDYVGIVPVVEATGSNVFDLLKATLKKLGLIISDCIGFGSDGASTMVGKHNSVWARI